VCFPPHDKHDIVPLKYRYSTLCLGFILCKNDYELLIFTQSAFLRSKKYERIDFY